MGVSPCWFNSSPGHNGIENSAFALFSVGSKLLCFRTVVSGAAIFFIAMKNGELGEEVLSKIQVYEEFCLVT